MAATAAVFEVSGRHSPQVARALRQEGEAGLESRSSAPHLVASKLPSPWLAMIARLRREYRMMLARFRRERQASGSST